MASPLTTLILDTQRRALSAALLDFPACDDSPEALDGLPPPELALVGLVEEFEVLDGWVGTADLHLRLDVLLAALAAAFVNHRVDGIPHLVEDEEVEERDTCRRPREG